MRLALIGAVLLAGCASHEAHLASRRVVGLTRAQMAQCAGPPDRTVSADGQDVAVYKIDVKGSDLSISFPLLGKLDASTAGQCEAVWTLRAGRVASLYFTDDAAGLTGRDSACAALVRGCLAMLDRSGR